MAIAMARPCTRHVTYNVEKIRNGHQITSPQAAAASEWAIPQPAALAITAKRGGRISSKISSAAAMINVSINGANSTSSSYVDRPLTGKLGPATCGSNDDTNSDSSKAGIVVSGHPTKIARSGRCGSSSAGKRIELIN